MARTALNVELAVPSGTGILAFADGDIANGNKYANTGVVVAILRATSMSVAAYVRFIAQIPVGPDDHYPHRDVAIATGTNTYVCEVLDRYYYNTADGFVEISYLDESKAPLAGTHDIDVALFRVVDL